LYTINQQFPFDKESKANGAVEIGMFRHGYRSLSPAVHGWLPGRPPRITIQVIRSAAKTAMSQAQTSDNGCLVI